MFESGSNGIVTVSFGKSRCGVKTAGVSGLWGQDRLARGSGVALSGEAHRRNRTAEMPAWVGTVARLGSLADDGQRLIERLDVGIERPDSKADIHMFADIQRDRVVSECGLVGVGHVVEFDF